MAMFKAVVNIPETGKASSLKVFTSPELSVWRTSLSIKLIAAPVSTSALMLCPFNCPLTVRSLGLFGELSSQRFYHLEAERTDCKTAN